MHRLARVAVAMTVAMTLALAGCTSPDTTPDPSPPTSSASSISSTEPTATSSSSTSSTPVTQLGMLSGPGVDNTEITLGTLVDPASDRGFLVGVQLWRTSVNNAGGICGRTVTLVGNNVAGVPAGLPDAYRALGTQVLGFVVDTADGADTTSLAENLSADGIPAIATSGSIAELSFQSPTVVGATDDILAINALDAAVAAQKVRAGDRIGVIADGSSSAASALTGLRWYAARANLTLVIQTATGRDLPAMAGLPLVFALGDAALTEQAVAELTGAIVVTTLPRYDPALLDAAQANRVQISMTTPAPGSEQPGIAAVESALGATGQSAGADTFAGYAAGATWGRLLGAACDAQSLTRSGVLAARLTVGPASVESLIGASDPALPAEQRLPATRSSAIAAGDLTTPSGLVPLTGLIVAAGIEEYRSPR